MTSCTCEPIDLGDGEISEHDGSCARAWDHLTTAEGIAVVRRCIMMADAANRAHGGLSEDFIDGNTAHMAMGLTARAVELGLERP